MGGKSILESLSPLAAALLVEFTALSLAGKALTVLHVLGPLGAVGLDGATYDEESASRTAAAIGRSIGMRGNNIDKALRQLESEGCAERIGGTQGRGSRWRIVSKGIRTIRRLWLEDRVADVIVGQFRISLSPIVDLLGDKFDCEKTPDGLTRFLVNRGWLPYLHSGKQNSQRSRERYDPFGYGFTGSTYEGPTRAIEVAAVAITVLLNRRTKDSLIDASSIAFALVRSRPNQVPLLLSLASSLKALGSSQKTIEVLFELLGSGEVPDKALRVASYEALLRMHSSRSTDRSGSLKDTAT